LVVGSCHGELRLCPAFGRGCKVGLLQEHDVQLEIEGPTLD
jgi:hypothetical protein